jgi:hypothetical protein
MIWLQNSTLLLLQDEPSGYFSDESDEDIPEELKKDFVDENVGDTISTKSVVILLWTFYDSDQFRKLQAQNNNMPVSGIPNRVQRR